MTAWPIEVEKVFSRVPGADLLDAAAQNRLKGMINRHWLERTPVDQVIKIAETLAEKLDGIHDDE